MSNLLNWWCLFSAWSRLQILDIPPKWFLIAQKYDLSNDIIMHIFLCILSACVVFQYVHRCENLLPVVKLWCDNCKQ